MKALILAGGDLKFNKEVYSLCQNSDLIIAADSGLRHAKKLNLIPQIIIGDFDSVEERTLAQFPKIKKLSYPSKKDKLDLELALDYAISKFSTEIILIAATGDRLDQTLAAILIAAKIAKNTKISLHSGHEDIFFLADKSKLNLELAKNTNFSLLSLKAKSIISLKGAEYNLNKFQLGFGLGLGVSNIVLNPPIELNLDSGLVAVIIEHI